MEWINKSDVFYGGGGKKKLDVIFPAKKAVDERWEVVNAQSTLQIIDRHYEELKSSRLDSQTLKKSF